MRAAHLRQARDGAAVGGTLHQLSGNANGSKKHMSFRPWGVILAGGEGTRLKAVSRLVSGDNRPKQFWMRFGISSLFAPKRGWNAPVIRPGRLFLAVVRTHEPFYQPELADVEE